MREPIDPNSAIGVVSLSVADLDRSLDYYQRGIGLGLVRQDRDEAELGVGGATLVRLRAIHGARHVPRATGLYHFALRVPTRRDLAQVIQHLADAAVPIGGASDHLVSEALYLTDPDGHGIEIYRDRPRADWYDGHGNFRLTTIALDLAGVMAELEGQPQPWQGLPQGTDMGHIHLQVADVDAAEQFYVDVLGFDRMMRIPSASFIGAGGYHHHIGANSWAGRGLPPPPADAARLLSFEIVVPDGAALEATLGRARAGGAAAEQIEAGWRLHDPSSNEIILRAAQG